MKVPIIPQVQVTLDCNFDCAYCFQDHRQGVISRGIVRRILEKTVAYHKSCPWPDEPILLVWHGGEPLLAGIQFFEEIVDIERSFPNVRFTNRIQTNGSLIDESWAAFLAAHDFHVGFSLDGPEDIHNRNRCFRGSGKGTFARVMEGIRLYRKCADKDMLPVIAVVTKHSLGRENELFDFFRKLRARVQLDIYDLRCADLISFGAQSPFLPELAPSPAEVGRFLIRLFDLWFHDNSGQVDFNELRNEVKMLLRPDLSRGDPFHKKRCHPGRVIFDPRGMAFSCDQYVNDDATAIGHIETTSLEKILTRKDMLWEEVKEHIRGEGGSGMACRTCEWGEQHMGGCLTCMKYNALLLSTRRQGKPDHEWKNASLSEALARVKGETYYCDGLRMFRNHARKIIGQELENS